MIDLTNNTEEKMRIYIQTLDRRSQFALIFSKIVVIASPVFIGVQLVLWALSPKYTQLLVTAALTVLPGVGAILYRVFHYRQQSRVGIILFLILLLIDVTINFVLLPEINLCLTIVYVLLGILTYMLLDSKDAYWMLAIYTLAFLADIVLVSTGTPGWRIPIDKSVAWIVSMLMNVPTLPIVAFIFFNILREQEGFFVRFQEANLEIEQRATAEQTQRERLQTTVRKYVEYMANVARGELAARLSLEAEEQTDDPLIVLGRQLNETTASLQEMIMRILSAVENLSTAAAEILAATTQQSSGANEQSAAISQTTTTVDEVKLISEQAIARAQEVANTSQRTVEVSQDGVKAVQDTIESMVQIKERVEGIAENILGLSEQTLQVGEIIATVNEIASQSNILALNASIEAARAGELGKGFAIVAVEVRKLAEQSRQATEQVKSILSEIQKATNLAVMATEEGTKGVDKGVRMVAQARQAIDQLSGVINESAQAATQMVAGGRQQASGIVQIAQAMQNINQATVQNLASTRQAEEAAQNLNMLARKLTEAVVQYRL